MPSPHSYDGFNWEAVILYLTTALTAFNDQYDLPNEANHPFWKDKYSLPDEAKHFPWFILKFDPLLPSFGLVS